MTYSFLGGVSTIYRLFLPGGNIGYFLFRLRKVAGTGC
nr:MAG TPA: Neuromedin U [Caudoviricetes sp.]